MLAVACEKVPLTSPTGSTITMAISTNIPADQRQHTAVTAIVTESAGGSVVHNGTMVT